MNRSKRTITICVIYGTRPEVIKLAPVIAQLRKSPFKTTVVHTGQHHTLTNDLTNDFGLEPVIQLQGDENEGAEPTSRRSDIGQVIGLMGRVSRFLDDHLPDLVLVQGDTASALAGAMAAHYLKIPVAHLEAGLRSHDRTQPFPEETNRVLISHLADLHFAPTSSAAEQLIREQIDPTTVHVTGNSVVDALQSILQRTTITKSDIRRTYDAEGKLVILTTHRRENLGDPQRRIVQAVAELARRHSELLVLWPVHPNPAIRAVLDSLDLPANFRTMPPLGYIDFLPLLQASDLVLTDSGGIQEEAPALGVPVVILREKTERPEVIEAGYGVLAGSDPKAILDGAERFLAPGAPEKATSLYGDGTTSEQVVHLLSTYFGL